MIYWQPLIAIVIAATIPHIAHPFIYAPGDSKLFNYSMSTYYRYWLQSNIWFVVIYLVAQYIFAGIHMDDTPIWWEMIKVITFMAMFETSFYWWHRALHSSHLLYTWIHALHHRTKQRMCIWDYCVNTTAEHVIINGVYMVLMQGLQIHVYTLCIGLVLFSIESCRTHSHYDSDHVDHHKYVNCNYGLDKRWDVWMGTYKYPEQTQSHKRGIWPGDTGPCKR